jgi:hypothetical protein
MALYAQTSGTLSTNSGSWTAIPGLSISLPAGVGTTAIVIVNAGQPYATGNDYPGGFFGVSVNGTVSPVVACFTYSDQAPSLPGRVPTTLVVAVPLADAPQTVLGMWVSVRSSNLIIDSPATLTALLD